MEPGADMEATYIDALHGGPGGGTRGDIHLMRLLQVRKPILVWWR